MATLCLMIHGWALSLTGVFLRMMDGCTPRCVHIIVCSQMPCYSFGAQIYIYAHTDTHTHRERHTHHHHHHHPRPPTHTYIRVHKGILQEYRLCILCYMLTCAIMMAWIVPTVVRRHCTHLAGSAHSSRMEACSQKIHCVASPVLRNSGSCCTPGTRRLRHAVGTGCEGRRF